MKARKYTKIIEIWKTITEPDGYGGNVVTNEFVNKHWANVETKRSFRTNEIGRLENNVVLVFTIRNRDDFFASIEDDFIKYKGLIYNIDSVLNIGLLDIDIELTATQRE